jgi:hypothetical protein
MRWSWNCSCRSNSAREERLLSRVADAATRDRTGGLYVSRTDIPPSAIIGLLITKLARSESRTRAACAISSALATLESAERIAFASLKRSLSMC